MNERKNKQKIKMIICVIVGLTLILSGALTGANLRNRTFDYSEDFYFERVTYEFEIDTKEKLDVNTGVVKIKVRGVNKESFSINFDEEDSDIQEGEYIFNIVLNDNDADIFNEVLELVIYNENGKLLTFKPQHSIGSMIFIPLAIVQVFIGIVLMFIGLATYFNKHSKEQKEIEKTSGGEKSVTTQSEKIEIKKEEKTVTCSYCGLENISSNAKCEYCGGPLYKRK